ncbi:MAG: hypothetical protein ACI9W4_001798 [Rhodothermales bacterium]|jgi:hypothetical protein
MPRLLPCLLLMAFLAIPATAQDNQEYTWTATFVESPPRVDGHLDDAAWEGIEAITEFIQVWPEDGAAATERSEVRIAYDRDNLYFAFKFYDSEPDLIRAKNLERGGRNDRDDHAYISLDTYMDGRNAYLFEMNALGTQDDATITDEGMTLDSFSWDAVFLSETVIDDEGWSMEVSIPFRQLRFPKGEQVEFGLMLSRTVNRKNERSLWPPIGLEYGSSFGVLSAVSQYGRLTGIENVRRGKNIEIKPYVITGAQTSRPDLAQEATEDDFTKDFGVDLKWGIRSDLTLDLTVNTDFAQVESDNVQLNLGRFSLFFPEKREFFLERSGLFEHGNSRSTQTFFSRRIGLSDRILSGARMTGQIGRFAVGVLNIETGDGMKDLFGSGSANNTVIRARTTLTSRSTAGAILTNLERADGSFNRAAGIDGQFRFWSSSRLTGWFTDVTDTDPGQEGRAGHISLRLQNDLYGVQVQHTNVGENYRPALGFVRRRDQVRYALQTSYSPVVELAAVPFVRRFAFLGNYEYIEGQAGDKQSTEIQVQARADFNRRDKIEIEFQRHFERLVSPFSLRDAEIRAGDYTFAQLRVSGGTDQSRRAFASARVSAGGFWDGNRTDLGGTIGFRHSQFLTIEGGLNHSIIDLPSADEFSATTISSSILAAVNRNLFAKGLIQYDNFSRDIQANIRIDWIHTPGSDLFFVFNTSYHLTADNDILFDPRRDAIMNNVVGVAKLTYLILL